MNFDTDKIIIVCYPPSAGGKFLINCLGLNEEAVFLHPQLAKYQLNYNFSVTDKMSYLEEKLNNTKHNWNDLGMNFIDILSDKEVAQAVIEYNKYMFFVSHGPFKTNNLLKIWKNATVIFFENPDNFVANRNICFISLENYWSKLRTPEWPHDPPETLDDIYQLPDNVVNDLMNKYNGGIIWFYDECKDLVGWNDRKHLINSDKILVWDTKWYQSSDKVIEEIEKLYGILNLPNFNKSMTLKYYTSWIKVIEKVSFK